jgi:hypothetical protein
LRIGHPKHAAGQRAGSSVESYPDSGIAQAGSVNPKTSDAREDSNVCSIS